VIKINKTDILGLMAFLVSSARNCINEPKIYGSFRLADTVSKIVELLKVNNLLNDDEIDKVVKKIDDGKYSCMTDENEFVLMLDEVTDDLVELIKLGNG
jgi:hypothetical protein